MAVYRSSQKCPKCGIEYNGIYRDNDGTFIGDDFVRWDIEGHVCPSAKSVEVEEAEWINTDQQLNGADFLIEVNKILKTYPNTSSIKIVKLYMKQQQKQADTISRLREENERLRRSLTEIAAGYDCHEDYLRMLAKEALKSL